MTDRAASERSPPFARLLPRSWGAEAHRLLVSPAGELSGPELEAARRLARLVGSCASEFVREGASGANSHEIEAESAPAAYVRFIVAVLHDFGPAASRELERWKRRLHGEAPLDDPRLEAFRQGYESRPGESPASGGGSGRSLHRA